MDSGTVTEGTKGAFGGGMVPRHARPIPSYLAPEPFNRDRAEMYGAAIGAAIASNGDTQYIDNMAITKCAHRQPTHKCSDADIRHKVCDQVQHKRVAAEWIANHCLESEAPNAQEREQTRRNGEVELLAKMATRLPVPEYDPRRPEDIAICGGPTPTPARKWILQWRRVVTFYGAHWVSGLPMRGDRHMLCRTTVGPPPGRGCEEALLSLLHPPPSIPSPQSQLFEGCRRSIGTFRLAVAGLSSTVCPRW